MEGRGKLTTTGKLGDVMQESAHAAMSYVRSRAHLLGLARDFYRHLDIHVHVPEGAKDWTGKLVMLRSDGVISGKPGVAGLEVSDKRLTANYVYKVRVEKSEFIELVGYNWIFKADAILVDDATAFFTAEIKKHPKDAKYYGRRALAHASKRCGAFVLASGKGLGTGGDVDSVLSRT